MKEYTYTICVTNDRLLVPIKVNNKSVYFLVDTGSQVPLIDYTQREELGIEVASEMQTTLTGVNGEGGKVYRPKAIDVDFEGNKLYQFLLTDLSAIRKSIKRDTDYDIAGILSLKQMQDLGWIIDTATGKIYYKED